MTELIPIKKLVEGFNKSREHIGEILNDCKLLYGKKRFVSCMGLAILAQEELVKMNLLRNHISEQKSIQKENWKAFSQYGSHSSKLTALYKEADKETEKLSEAVYNIIVQNYKKLGSGIKYRSSYSEIKKSSKIALQRLESLNKIKKACWYLDWENCDWLTLSTNYTEKDLHILANYLLQLTMSQYAEQMLSYRYASSIFYEIRPELNVMTKDPLWKEC
ncbi:MAG: AbiV family abortive infection protein [Thaumarchaeota archaeon]|nr:AbiV family abortive infection protein [Nitrososphaerota archaeon]